LKALYNLQYHFEVKDVSSLIFIGKATDAFQTLKPSGPFEPSIFDIVRQSEEYLGKILAHSLISLNLKVIK
jgi:hypothetical protein